MPYNQAPHLWQPYMIPFHSYFNDISRVIILFIMLSPVFKVNMETNYEDDKEEHINQIESISLTLQWIQILRCHHLSFNEGLRNVVSSSEKATERRTFTWCYPVQRLSRQPHEMGRLRKRELDSSTSSGGETLSEWVDDASITFQMAMFQNVDSSLKIIIVQKWQKLNYRFWLLSNRQ